MMTKLQPVLARPPRPQTSETQSYPQTPFRTPRTLQSPPSTPPGRPPNTPLTRISPGLSDLSPDPPEPELSSVSNRETGDTDADSTWEDEASSTCSLTGSILSQEERHGRLFEKWKGSYIYPIDDKEYQRYHVLHKASIHGLQDRLFLAPIDHNWHRLVFDIGSGNGDWMDDFAMEYTSTEVVGCDISPPPPWCEWLPPNARFLLADIEDEVDHWLPGRQIDFIHDRHMAGSIKDWPRLLKRCYDNLAPAGLLECQEIDYTLRSDDDTIGNDNPLDQLLRGLTKAHEKIGYPLNLAPLLGEWMRNAGFHCVVERKIKLPIGIWPKDGLLKEIGALMATNFHEGADALTAKPFRDVLGWSDGEVEVLKAKIRGEAQRASKGSGVHSYLYFFVVTAEKPMG